MKFLIIYATAGAGHKKAAEAIYEALLEKVDKKDLQIIDSLDYTNRFFKWLYSKKYLTLINYMPNMWGFFYFLFNRWFIYKLLWFPRRLTNAIMARRFENFICSQGPEVIITTHFMANEIISSMKQRCKLDCRLFTCVTDYRIHSFWIADGVDGYFVAADRTKDDLLRRGAAGDKIYVTGVPISLKFSYALDRQKAQVKLGLNIGLFTVLIIGGGFGIGPLDKLVLKIGTLPLAVQLVVVCGFNEKLYEDIEETAAKHNIKAKIFKFVDNVHELMSASDVLVTKSGGLTSAEAMAKCLPTIFVRPIPGQEKRNSRVLKSVGAALIAKDPQDAAKKIEKIFRNQAVLNKMRAAIKNIARPQAARDIVKICTQR